MPNPTKRALAGKGKNNSEALREAVREQGIPMLRYEAGKALRFNEAAIRVGLRGILHVMRAIGQLPTRKADHTPIELLLARSTKWVRAPKSGMIHSSTQLGERVRKGDALCMISEPSGEDAEAILSPASGIVIGHSNLPLVHRGDALFHIACFNASAPVEPILDAYEDGLDLKDFEPLAIAG